MFDWIRKNINIIFVIVVVMGIVSPIIFTREGFPSFCFSGTGQIGDTIGGLTAPFWGFLSVILLYLTLKEQQFFNKTQQSASDLNALFSMQERIEKLGKEIKIDIANTTGTSQSYLGLENIEQLNSLVYGQSRGLNEESFNILYDNISAIANWILLFYKISDVSAIDNSLKKSFCNVVFVYSEKVSRFYFLCDERHIHIINGIHSMDDNVLEMKKVQTEKYIKELKEWHDKALLVS